MEIKPEDLMYSAEKIAEMSTWHYYQGFTGDSCSKCKKTINILAGGPGWFCVCGHYNLQSQHYFWIPHENPDLGPSRETIFRGHELATNLDNSN